MYLRMKKYLFALFFVALIMACGGKHQGGNSTPNNLSWGLVERDTIILLGSQGGSPKAELHLKIHYIKDKGFEQVNDSLLRDGMLVPDYLWNNDTMLTVRQAVDTYIRMFADDYRRDYGAMYRSDLGHAESYNAQFSCQTTVETSRDGIVNYLAETFYFGGGQHGVEMLMAKNIDTRNGHILNKNDLFVPGHEDRLAEMVVEQLCQQLGLKSLDELHSKGFFVGLEPYATDNFIVGRHSVTFVYGDSEIAPHEEGIVRVEIANSQLKDLLR